MLQGLEHFHDQPPVILRPFPAEGLQRVKNAGQPFGKPPGEIDAHGQKPWLALLPLGRIVGNLDLVRQHLALH